MIEKHDNNTLASSLAEQVHKDIIAQGLREDELFMTCDNMVEKYGVSRGIVREAVSQLNALGILKSRQGKGLLVGRTNPVNLLERCLPFYGRMAEDIDTLARLRYVLEVGAVDFAVNNASDQDIERLDGLARQFRKLVTARERDDTLIDEIEVQFHGLLLKLSNNGLVSGMHKVLSRYFETIKENASTITGDSTIEHAIEHAIEHEAIVEGFRQRDTEMTRTYLRRHLRGIFNDNSSFQQPNDAGV